MSNITDRLKARKSMGFCLQQNILYDSLTVGEHMRFIAKLREIPSELVDIKVFFKVPKSIAEWIAQFLFAHFLIAANHYCTI